MFQTYAWSSSWFKAIGAVRGLVPCIGLIEDSNGEPLMLLPLAIESHPLHKALVWIGDILADYHCPILGPKWADSSSARNFAATWQELRDALPPHDVVTFEKQPATIGRWQNPFVNLAVRPHPARAHYAKLGDSLEDFLRQRRSARSLQSHRRKERRLAEEGRPDFVVAEAPDIVALLLEAMIKQKSRSYAELGVADIFAEPGCTEFITHMTTQYPDTVRLFALMLHNEPLSVIWGLVHRKRFYHLFPSYAKGRYSASSPGNIMLIRALDWCINNGVEIYDFTVGDEEYKNHWCEFDLLLFDMDEAVHFRGIPFTLLRRARGTLKQFIKNSPPLFTVAKYLRRKSH